MVARLAVADATVNELAEPYDVTVQAVSKHLKVLKDAGLVSRSREAQRRPVHLEAEVFDLMTKWIERYRDQAQERYLRLDEVLQTIPDEVDPMPPRKPRTAALIRSAKPQTTQKLPASQSRPLQTGAAS
jgi:DNA-binding transcriptional ArsR family regulator